MKNMQVNDEPQDQFKYKPIPFGPPLIHTFLTDTHHALMLEDAKIVRKEAIPARDILVGKIKDEFLFNNALTRKWEEILKPYFMNYLMSCAHRLSQNSMTLPDYHENTWQTIWQTIAIEKLWINYQKKNEYNPQHIHSGVISFVIYLDVPQQIFQEENTDTGPLPGTIQFVTGMPNFFDENKNVVERLQSYVSYAAFSPKSKDFLIFPAYLNHSVAPFSADVERVSVSGNWIIPETTLS